MCRGAGGLVAAKGMALMLGRKRGGSGGVGVGVEFCGGAGKGRVRGEVGGLRRQMGEESGGRRWRSKLGNSKAFELSSLLLFWSIFSMVLERLGTVDKGSKEQWLRGVII